MTGRGGTCGSGFSRELLAPSPAKAGEGWGGVPSGSVRTVSTPSQPPLPSQGEGPKQELAAAAAPTGIRARSEEHTSELQSLMRISSAVFCLKKKQHLNYMYLSVTIT